MFPGDLHLKSSKRDHSNCDQFAPNFYMVLKTTQRFSVPNLKLFGVQKTDSWAKEVGEFSVMLNLVSI